MFSREEFRVDSSYVATATLKQGAIRHVAVGFIGSSPIATHAGPRGMILELRCWVSPTARYTSHATIPNGTCIVQPSMRTRLRGCRQHRHRPTDKSSGAPLTMVHRSCPCFAPICRDLTAHCVSSPRPPLPAPPWPEWIPAPLPLPPPAPAFDVETPPSPAARDAELDRLVGAEAPFVDGVGAAEACTRMTDWALSTGPAILRVPPTVLSIKWQAASRSAVLQPRRQRELAPHRCGSSGKQLAALTSHRRAPTTASLEAAARPASREVPSPSEVQHRRGLLVPSSGTAQVKSRRRLTVQARLEQYRSRRWWEHEGGGVRRRTVLRRSTARHERRATHSSTNEKLSSSRCGRAT